MSDAAPTIQSPLVLPSGARLKNRLAKAAMTEGLADPQNRATPALQSLYRRWARNGMGLMLTGNIQIDRQHLERPGNLALEDRDDLDSLRSLSALGTQDGAHFWAQINHPGRSTPAAINPRPLSPSGISLPIAEAGCGEAQAIDQAGIHEVILRFARTAALCREAGFTGVQIHAAHGYLLSQFLSPLSNTRTDQWGGALANRARLLLEVVRAVRNAVGNDFPVSVKLNSADFQRGGFSEDESAEVVCWLAREQVDLLEISGGNYEQMQMVGLGDGAATKGRPVAGSTLAREAYFLDYALRIRKLFPSPIMITGGMRSLATMNEALQDGACEMIGIGRPLCVQPDGAVAALLTGSADALPAPERGLAMGRDHLGPGIDDAAFKRLESFGLLGWYCLQILRLGRGDEVDEHLTVAAALMGYKQSEEAAARRVLESRRATAARAG